MQIYINLANWT